MGIAVRPIDIIIKNRCVKQLDLSFGLRYKTDYEKYEGKKENGEELKVIAFYESVTTQKYVIEIEQSVVATHTAIMGSPAAF